jgi:hypothetical protein
VFESVGGRKVVCESSDAEWTPSQTDAENVLDAGMSFKGCVEPVSGVSCGEFGTTALKGRLEITSGAGSPEAAVGLWLFPVDRHYHHDLFAQFKCVGMVRLKGSVMSTIEPVDIMTNTFTRTYSLSGAGGEGLAMSFKLNESFEQTGLIQEAVTTTVEPVEIRAYED